MKREYRPGVSGIEPTGHYWLNLAYFLEKRGIPLVMINLMHVKRSKELDDNLPTKHDRKDALVIARLLKHGRFSYQVFSKTWKLNFE